ncbi:MAG: HAMP domain-containing protein [Deltaproteobacteria bacterium]|nr:HAMP domain-containing protein [Deltaproteobacteria bacterium]MBW1915297.1 HAMP domain-containing protein [Deltaproteobacteria bacterium]
MSIGVYFNLAHILHTELDASLQSRASQILNFRDILTIVKEGRFEGDVAEFINIYYYPRDNTKLTHISFRSNDIPVSEELLAQTLAGLKSFNTIDSQTGGHIRVYAVPFSNDMVDSSGKGSVNKMKRPLPERPGPNSRNSNKSGKKSGKAKRGSGKQNPPPRPPNNQKKPAILIIGRSTENIEQTLDGLLHTLLIFIPVTMLFSGAGGLFLARRALQPVDQITRIARDIGESDLSGRITVHTKDELGWLARILNNMIERLEKAFLRQKEFTADASHELRAPLAVIEAESTFMLQRPRSEEDYQRSLELVAQETRHMSNIINQLLMLARGDSNREQVLFQEINLGRFLREFKKDGEVLCRDKELELHLDQVKDLIINGDAMQLKQLFMNLLQNGIRYTDKGGIISVSLRREGDTAVATMSDSGIGIPESALPYVFERFYRVDKARSRSEGGSGLGLAICKLIAENHKGSIEVDSKEGEGSTFFVRLPLA